MSEDADNTNQKATYEENKKRMMRGEMNAVDIAEIGEAIDKTILTMLRVPKNSAGLSTYLVAKKAGVSWSTANQHLYRLADSKKLKHKTVIEKHQTKIIWTLNGVR